MDHESTDRLESAAAPGSTEAGRRSAGRPRRRPLFLVACALVLATTAAYLFAAHSRAVEARARQRISDLGGEVSVNYTVTLLPGIEPDSIINRYIARFTSRNQLNSIEIAGKPVTDDDLTLFVSEFPYLTRLNLDSTGITDRSAVRLGDCRHLSEVDLDGTDIADDSLAALATLPNLSRLSVVGTQITDAGLVHLQQSTSLKLLIASNTRITGTGAEALEAAVPGCIVLR